MSKIFAVPNGYPLFHPQNNTLTISDLPPVDCNFCTSRNPAVAKPAGLDLPAKQRSCDANMSCKIKGFSNEVRTESEHTPNTPRCQIDRSSFFPRKRIAVMP